MIAKFSRIWDVGVWLTYLRLSLLSGELGSSLAQMRTTHMHAQRGVMGLRGASMAGKRHQRMSDVLSPNSMALSRMCTLETFT